VESTKTFTVTAGAVTFARARYGTGLPMAGCGVQVHTDFRKPLGTTASIRTTAAFAAVNDDTRAFRTWSPPV
jgi:hypothetical protein